MIVITGAAGFIGSCLAAKLNEERYFDLVLVDDFSHSSKKANFEGKTYTELVHRDHFAEWLRTNQRMVQFVFHLGARTDTTEFDKTIFDRLNLEYSKQIWNICVEFGLPLVYASSAATYGDGAHGFDDNHQIIPSLKPLNPYGDSKQDFDIWALEQERKPFFWVGLKFFNVYGPNEYHKGRMASVVFHAYHQLKQNGTIKLFRSHRSDYTDGGQLRDFIYVKDIVDICHHLMITRKHSGIFNAGSGQARTFLELAKATITASGLEGNIEYIDIPADIRDKYQYHTEAKMDKLRKTGYTKAFHKLEEGIADYVSRYLAEEGCY